MITGNRLRCFVAAVALLLMFLTACQPASGAGDQSATPGAGPTTETLTPEAASDATQAPSFSPESLQGRVIFLTARDGNTEFYSMAMDGREQTRLTLLDSDESGLTISSLGQIAFISRQPASPDFPFVHIAEADGSGLTRLAFTGSAQDLSLHWSPDGRQLAAAALNTDFAGATSGTFFILERDGLTATRFDGQDPAWSPDSATIAFSAPDDEDLNQIYLFNFPRYPEGQATPTPVPGTPVQEALAITANTEGPSFAPQWSPDGRSIAFLSTRSGVTRLFAVTPDGSAERRISGDEPVQSFDWSPRGDSIAYLSMDEAEQHRLYVVASGGGDPIDVSQGEVQPGTYIWSPDGFLLAFVSLRDGNPEVYVVGADGGGLRNLSQNPRIDSLYQWLGDSALLAGSNRDGDDDIYILPLSGADPMNLSNNQTFDGRALWLP